MPYRWILLGASLTAMAQEPLTLTDAVSRALSSHPRLAGAEAGIAAAYGLRAQAGTGPNPRLTLQTENTRFYGSPAFNYGRDADTFVYAAQTFETGGKRARRVDLATVNVRRSEIEREVERRQIVTRVSAAYWAAAGASELRALLQQELTRFERVVQYHRDRVKEGATAEVNLLKIEVERDRLASSVRSAAQEATRAAIALYREMGQSKFPDVAFSVSLEAAPSAAAAPLSQVFELRPEIKLAREGIARASANLRLQQANAKGDPEAQLGYKRTAGFNTVYGAVHIPIPIRNRNQGNIAAAAAEIRVAESVRTATEAAIRAEVAAAQADYESRKKLLEETLRPMRDRAAEVYRIEDAAYREGGSDILRLLDAERTRIETQSMYTRTLIEYQQSAVALQAAQGMFP